MSDDTQKRSQGDNGMLKELTNDMSLDILGYMLVNTSPAQPASGWSLMLITTA